jgi:hypothetical protein
MSTNVFQIPTAKQIDAAFARSWIEGFEVITQIQARVRSKLEKSWPTLTEDTKKRFVDTVASVSQTLDKVESCTWSGEPTMRILNDVVRDLQSLAVKLRTGHCIPSGVELHKLSQIPGQLHMAVCRLVAEAPAMVNAASTEHKQGAGEAVTRFLIPKSNWLLQFLATTHQILQDESDQMQEIQDLVNGQGYLRYGLTEMQTLAVDFDLVGRCFAPQSNPQTRMFLAEISSALTSLDEALRRCR